MKLIKQLYYLLIYLFCKPSVKEGNQLQHAKQIGCNLTCHGIYFNWQTGEWYLKISEGENYTAISWSVEREARKQLKLKTA